MNHSSKKNPKKISQKSNLQISKTAIFSGPIPRPELLKEYGDISPDFPERILKMAETQAAERHRNQKTIIETNANSTKETLAERKRGQWFGFIVAIVGIVSALILAWMDAKIAAAVVGGTPLLTLAGLFITGKYRSDKTMINNNG